MIPEILNSVHSVICTRELKQNVLYKHWLNSLVLAVEGQPAPNRIRNTRNCPQLLRIGSKNIC